MKTHYLIILAVLLIAGICYSTYYFIDHLETKDEFTIEFDFNIVESGMGFNLDKDKMHFGDFTAEGASSIRTIILSNNETFKKKVKFYISIENQTETSSWLKVEPLSRSLLGVGESKNFTLRIDPPSDTPIGHYEGLIYIKINKAWPWDKEPEIYRELKGCFSNTYKMFTCGDRVWSCPYREQ